MIEVTVGQIANAVPVLNKLIGESFLGKKAFVIARLVREASKEGEIFENARIELIKKYAEKDDNGEIIISEEGQVHIPPEKLLDCNNELLNLQETIVEINAEKLPIDWLEEINLTLTEATMLEPFVEI